MPWQHFLDDSLSACEEIVDSTLKTQTDWAHQYFEMIANNNDETTPFAKWSETMDTLVDSWTETERQCCNAWFSNMLQQRSANSADKTATAMNSWWKTWQDTMQKTLEMQAMLADQLVTHETKRTSKATKP